MPPDPVPLAVGAAGAHYPDSLEALRHSERIVATEHLHTYSGPQLQWGLREYISLKLRAKVHTSNSAIGDWPGMLRE